MQIIGGLGVGVFIATMFIAWRLSAGPVSLSFLTPALQGSLNEIHDGSLDITLEDTILTWAGWERTLDIRMVNMQASLKNGDKIASIPEVSVSFSARALLKGVIAPRSIEFFGPDLLAVRDAGGDFRFGFEGNDKNSGGFAAKLLAAMLQAETPSHPMSYLSRINVVSGQLTYIDNMLGVTWYAPMADARLRKIESGLEAELNLGVDISGTMADLSVQGTFDNNIKRFDFGVSFQQLNPSMLAQMFPEIDLVSAIDAPLSGTITFNASSNGQVENLGFDLTSDGGHIALPVKLAAKLDMLPYAQRIKIDSLKTIGRFEGAYRNIEINEFDVQLADDQKVYLPLPLDMEMPLKRISLAGRYDGDKRQIEIEGAEINLGGPIAKIRTKINGINWPGSGISQDAISLGLSGVLYDMSMEKLGLFWPKIVAVDARNWVLEHMPTGVSPKAEISLSMISTSEGVHFEKLEGVIEGQGITVNYLPPMPVVVNASGKATFDKDSFNIVVNPTIANDGIMVNSGDIHFTKLNTNDPEADFVLNVSGPIASSLALIDSEPFNFAKKIGIDPKKTLGDSTTTLQIHFPFKRDLSVNDVTASATSTLVAAEFSEILFGRNLSMGNLELKVDNAKLSAIGTAKLGGVPVGLLWNHDFSDSAIFRDKYELTGRIDDVLNLGDMGIAFPQIITNYLSGGAEANVSYTVFGDDTRSLSARIDLANIHMASPELGWEKQAGVPGNAVLELRLKGEIPVEIPSFEISAPEMEVAGSSIFREDGKIDVININKFVTRRTSFSGSMVPHDDGTWEVSLLGDEFDASLMWKDFLGVGKDSLEGSLDETEFVFSGAADFKTLWFAEDRAVHDFIGTIYREGKLWKKLDMGGRVSETETINLRLETYEEKNERRFGILSNNAGAALRALDVYDLVIGGKLRLEATYDGTSKKAPLAGVLKVHDYALKEAPALANLVGVLSLTGILDALQGEGLSFDILELPFSLNNGVLEIKEARASGPSIGLTATGKADFEGKILDIEGTVVPAYAINSLLGNIPIIGQILSGPEKGSGVFAATYSMKNKGDNLEINFNPLSALAPGALRGIFSGSAKENELNQPATE
ncbi:MAG: hypothetical protein OEW37_05545 [Rhodospirillaceae bacterium]|nr:hypothetical protein [Rhodospirillaceae bacterium]